MECMERTSGVAGRPRGLVVSVLAGCLLLGGGAAGCVTAPRPVFEPTGSVLAWPPAPATTRLSYVGMLRCSADLKAPSKPFEGLSRLLIGKEPPKQLYGPRDVVVTPDGQRVWIADPGGRCLHLFDLEHRAYRKIAQAGGSPLLSPVDVSLGPAGSIFVCDSEAVAVYRLSAVSGETIERVRIPEDIARPVAASYDAGTQELFVVDVATHDIKVLGPDAGLRRILGRRGEGDGEFNFPTAIVASGEMLWVVDTGNRRVQAITRDGLPAGVVGRSGDAPGDMALPKGVAVDSDGHLYVVDARFENVQVFDPEGRLLMYFGEEGTGPAEFWLPGGIFIDRQDRIWVCDSYNRRVQVFQYLGTEGDGPPQEKVEQ